MTTYTERRPHPEICYARRKFRIRGLMKRRIPAASRSPLGASARARRARHRPRSRSTPRWPCIYCRSQSLGGKVTRPQGPRHGQSARTRQGVPACSSATRPTVYRSRTSAVGPHVALLPARDLRLQAGARGNRQVAQLGEPSKLVDQPQSPARRTFAKISAACRPESWNSHTQDVVIYVDSSCGSARLWIASVMA